MSSPLLAARRAASLGAPAAWHAAAALRCGGGSARPLAAVVFPLRRCVANSSSSSSNGESDASAPHPPPPSDLPLTAARARALQRSASPARTFRIAGVTFEGRQAAVAALAPGAALRLVREPDNPADPGAVRVETLAGAHLGYVPRDRTGELCPPSVGPACFARCLSVGQAHPDGEGEEEGGAGEGGGAGAPWGAAAILHPGLRPLEVDALPLALQAGGPADLAAWLPPPVWSALRAEAARAAGFRCEVTGGRGAGCAVAVHEAWALDPASRVATLTGLQALSPDAHIAKHALALTDLAHVAAALATLRAVNEWSTAEAAQHVKAAADAAASGPWRLDLGWLAGRGVDDLPPDVAAVCV